jgi:hypothetical protein
VVREDPVAHISNVNEKQKESGPVLRTRHPTGTPEVATMKARPRSAMIEKENLNQQLLEEANQFSSKKSKSELKVIDIVDRKPLKEHTNQSTIATLVEIAVTRLERARILAGRPLEIEHMTLEQLQEEKLAVKRELKSYDVNFSRKFGRMVTNTN